MQPEILDILLRKVYIVYNGLGAGFSLCGVPIMKLKYHEN
jgi:hypothetical protein